MPRSRCLIGATAERDEAEQRARRKAVLPVSAVAAFAGAGAAQETGGGMPADILIAGTALEHGLKVLTADAGLARLLGPAAELLRAS